eukprot:TRINITY_DN1255_c0_g1_i1.p1 TRINITY_DN1255_c0_g1~~TRINITY_DN1255_c0_g1_i1.p1  ORF type:complete len:925 (+),score=132.53 TRINITY_DN1255_c0_g1_i1:209-2776(+)
MCMALLPGIFMLKGDITVLGFLPIGVSFLDMFVLTDSPYYTDYMRAVGFFPEVRDSVISVTATSGSIMSVAYLKESIAIENEVIAEMDIKYDGKAYTFDDLCVRKFDGAPCDKTSLASLLVSNETLLNTKTYLDATPTELAELLLMPLVTAASTSGHPMQMQAGMALKLLPLLVGSASDYPGQAANVTQLATWLADAKSTLLLLKLKKGAESNALELRVQDYINRRMETRSSVAVSGYLFTTPGTECGNIVVSALWIVGVTIVCMVIYVVFWLATQTREAGHTQVIAVAMSTMVPGVASFAAIGLLGYMGFQINILVLMAPFLCLATGVDAIFVIVGAFKAIGPDEALENAIAKALADGGAAVVVAQLTSISACFAAALTSTNFPLFLVFNLALLVGIIFTSIGMMTIVPAMLVLNEKRIRAGRCDLLPCKRRKSEPGASLIHKLDPASRFKRFLVTKFAVLPQNSWTFRIFGVASFVSLMVASGVMVSGLDKGMMDRDLLTDGSYAQGFFDDMEQHYGKQVVSDIGILIESPDIADAEYRRTIVDLARNLSERDDIHLVDCWLVEFFKQLPESVGRRDVSAALTRFLETALGKMYERNIHLTNDGKDVERARCSVIAKQPLHYAKRAEQAVELKGMTEATGLTLTLFSPSFAVHVARYDAMLRLVLETVAYAIGAVFVCLLFFFPVHVATLAACNVSFVLLTVLGYMSFMGITCNAVTYTSSVMAVGFCVDYSCHVSHALILARRAGGCWRTKTVSLALQMCSYEVFHGCGTAVVGVILLFLADSVAFRSWCSVCIVITIIGGYFALVTLPAIVASFAALLEMSRPNTQTAQSAAEKSHTPESEIADGGITIQI